MVVVGEHHPISCQLRGMRGPRVQIPSEMFNMLADMLEELTAAGIKADSGLILLMVGLKARASRHQTLRHRSGSVGAALRRPKRHS